MKSINIEFDIKRNVNPNIVKIGLFDYARKKGWIHLEEDE